MEDVIKWWTGGCPIAVLPLFQEDIYWFDYCTLSSETCCFGLNALDQSSRRCNFECPTSGKITVLAQCNSNSQILVQVCRVLQNMLAWKKLVQEPQYEGFNNVFAEVKELLIFPRQLSVLEQLIGAWWGAICWQLPWWLADYNCSSLVPTT